MGGVVKSRRWRVHRLSLKDTLGSKRATVSTAQGQEPWILAWCWLSTAQKLRLIKSNGYTDWQSVNIAGWEKVCIAFSIKEPRLRRTGFWWFPWAVPLPRSQALSESFKRLTLTFPTNVQSHTFVKCMLGGETEAPATWGGLQPQPVHNLHATGVSPRQDPTPAHTPPSL